MSYTNHPLGDPRSSLLGRQREGVAPPQDTSVVAELSQIYEEWWFSRSLRSLLHLTIV